MTKMIMKIEKHNIKFDLMTVEGNDQNKGRHTKI